MSLLHLVHKSVIITFTDAAKNQFHPETSHAFLLTGVDAMGFLQIQGLKPGSHTDAEPASEPYWINKDLVREIHEFSPAKVKAAALPSNGQATKGETAVESGRIDLTRKPGKAKSVPKQKSALN